MNNVADGNIPPIYFPNPSSGELTLMFSPDQLIEDARLDVFDLNGKLMQQMSITLVEGENRVPFQLTNLPAGVYVIQLIGDSQVWRQQLILE